MSRLCSIREEEREIDRICSETHMLEKPPLLTAVEKLAVSTPTIKCNLWRMERMEAGDIQHKDKGSFIT